MKVRLVQTQTGHLQENRSLRGCLVFLLHLVLQEILEVPVRKGEISQRSR